MGKFLQISLLAYGTLITGGGVAGFLKAGSKASLVSGLLSGGLLLTAYSVANRNPKTGSLFALLITGLLIAVFAVRLAKTKKFVPSGLLLLLSAVEEIILIAAFFGAA